MTGHPDPAGGPLEAPDEAIAARHRASRVEPDGASWEVRRRWVARFGTETVWGRFRRRMPGPKKSDDRDRSGWWTLDFVPELADGILGVVGAVLVGIVVIILIAPILIGLLDVALVAFLAALGFVVRGLFGRPWVIEAVDESGRALRWRVKGWRASQQRMVEIRDQLAAGIIPPDAEATT